MLRVWTIITTVVMACAMSGAESNPPPRIVFLSPTCDAYFAHGGIDSSTYLHFHRKGTFRTYFDHIGLSGYVSKGTWTQDSNGIIRMSYASGRGWFRGRDIPEHAAYAAIWIYRDKTFMVNSSCITNLMIERAKVIARSEKESIWDWRKVDRIDFEAMTGSIPMMLGFLVKSLRLNIPLCFLMWLHWLFVFVTILLMALGLYALFFVKPTTPCPLCEKIMTRRAVKSSTRVYCPYCDITFKTLPVRHRWMFRLGCLLYILMVFLHGISLWLVMGLISFELARTAFNIFYARWLFNNGLELTGPPSTKRSLTFPAESGTMSV